MARKKRVALRKLTLHITLDDEQALASMAATIEREPAWVLGKLCHLAVGTVDLSAEVRRWLRGDTGWDAGLKDDEPVLFEGQSPDPPVVRVSKRKTVAEAPPTLDDVRAYLGAKSYGFDAEEFHAFYAANGWKQGSKPLVDWKAACVTWQKTWLTKGGGAATEGVSDWGKHRPKELDEPADTRTAPMFTGLEEEEEKEEEQEMGAEEGEAGHSTVW